MNGYARNAEFYACRIFGFVWIVLALFLLSVVINNPANSGMALGFLLLCGGMAYFHLSGKFDASLNTMEPPLVISQAPPARDKSILNILYLPEAIYLQKIVTYYPEQKKATGRFYVPMAHSYTHQPIEYVTAEQYVRCLSQLSYVLVGSLIQDRIADFDFTDFETFKRLMKECKMWFRRSDLRYVKNTLKEAEFELSLTLKEVRTLRVFSVCVLEIGGVVRGELEFVAPLNNRV